MELRCSQWFGIKEGFIYSTTTSKKLGRIYGFWFLFLVSETIQPQLDKPNVWLRNTTLLGQLLKISINLIAYFIKIAMKNALH